MEPPADGGRLRSGCGRATRAGRRCTGEETLVGGKHVARRDDRDLLALQREALDHDQAAGDRELAIARVHEPRNVVDQVLEAVEVALELVLEGKGLERARRRAGGGGSGGRRAAGVVALAVVVPAAPVAPDAPVARSLAVAAVAAGAAVASFSARSSFSSIERKSTFALAAASFSCTSREGVSSLAGTALPSRPTLA